MDDLREKVAREIAIATYGYGPQLRTFSKKVVEASMIVNQSDWQACLDGADRIIAMLQENGYLKECALPDSPA